MEAGEFRLVNDLGHWGSNDPVVLVLGQSVGAKQKRVYATGEFDKIAFADIRDRLLAVLTRVGLLTPEDDFDSRFTAAERDFAFASLVRCSLSRNHRTSGNPVAAAMADPVADRWVRNCMERWLAQPNPRLRLVVLLGITSGYMRAVQRRLGEIHRDTYRRVSTVHALAAGVNFVFAQHPSTICENHYQRWIGPGSHPKRDEVARVVAHVMAPT